VIKITQLKRAADPQDPGLASSQCEYPIAKFFRCFGAADQFKSNNDLDSPITNYALRNACCLAAGAAGAADSAVSSQQPPLRADTLRPRSAS